MGRREVPYQREIARGALMAELVVTDSAAYDLLEIIDIILLAAGVGVATKWQSRFDTKMQQLAIHPFCGTSRPEYGPDIRIEGVFAYLLFHTATIETVIILRVIDGRRNVTPQCCGDKV